jgi:elongation of very long chain fatty acids protein 4
VELKKQVVMVPSLATMADLGHRGMKYHSEYNYLISPAVLYGPPVAYILFALLGHFAMRTRESPKWVNSAMRLYNIGQIVVCIYMSIGMMSVLRGPGSLQIGPVSLPNVFGINSDYDSKAEWFVFIHYLTKFFDWFDTLWMILKKKSSTQMSFLHLYHHATIGVVWGFLLSTGHANGTCRYGAWINSVTHVIMYSHYLWTSFGLQNPLKNYITMWQIFQFYTCFAHANVILFILPSMETKLPHELAWLQFFYHISMVYLFTFKLRWVPAFIKGDSGKKDGKIKSGSTKDSYYLGCADAKAKPAPRADKDK